MYSFHMLSLDRPPFLTAINALSFKCESITETESFLVFFTASKCPFTNHNDRFPTLSLYATNEIPTLRTPPPPPHPTGSY